MNTLRKNQLQYAYLNTIFSLGYEFRVEVCPLDENLKFGDFLRHQEIRTWAIITSDNPFSNSLQDSENDLRRSELKNLLEDRNFKFVSASGKGRSGDWPAEHGFFISNISSREALEIGRRFGQNAILFGEDSSGLAMNKWVGPSSEDRLKELLRARVVSGSRQDEIAQIQLLRSKKVNPHKARLIIAEWQREENTHEPRDLDYKHFIINKLERLYEREELD